MKNINWQMIDTMEDNMESAIFCSIAESFIIRNLHKKVMEKQGFDKEKINYDLKNDRRGQYLCYMLACCDVDKDLAAAFLLSMITWDKDNHIKFPMFDRKRMEENYIEHRTSMDRSDLDLNTIENDVKVCMEEIMTCN